jgi:molybdopterin-guanine dinucleotide biosynthesis protein A
MNNLHTIAGVVLAGGRSSRMGQNKALLDYQGKPLIKHMIDILKRTRIEQIFISGDINGYDCLSDQEPFAGPAEAIKSVINRLSGYAGLLFIPVDMPLLNPEMLHLILQRKEGGYFIDRPLPAYITPPYPKSEKKSIQGLLYDYDIYPVELPEQFSSSMKNANTQQDWEEVQQLEREM